MNKMNSEFMRNPINGYKEHLEFSGNRGSNYFRVTRERKFSARLGYRPRY